MRRPIKLVVKRLAKWQHSLHSSTVGKKRLVPGLTPLWAQHREEPAVLEVAEYTFGSRGVTEMLKK